MREVDPQRIHHGNYFAYHTPLTGDRELAAILPQAGVCREREFTRGVDREAVLGSAGGLLTLPFGIAQGTKLRPVIHPALR
jgi:hypothetical protein